MRWSENTHVLLGLCRAEIANTHRRGIVRYGDTGYVYHRGRLHAERRAGRAPQHPRRRQRYGNHGKNISHVFPWPHRQSRTFSKRVAATRCGCVCADQPRFVSKKEREQHKIEAENAENEAATALHERIRTERRDWESQGVRELRENAAQEARAHEPVREESANEPAPENDATASVRERYLGERYARPRKARRTEGNKRFLFEWEESDDTSAASLASDTLPSLGGRAGMEGSERQGTTGGRSSVRSTLAEKPWTAKRLDEMKERDWRIFREDYEISVRGRDIAPPLREWRESSIPKPVLDAVSGAGYREPTPVQRQAIPIALQRRDLIGIAETGSGKTASFVVPMLAYVLSLPKLNAESQTFGPYALVLAPTRELAQQIESEAQRLARRLGLTIVSLVGGRDIGEQGYSLRNGAEIVIATPGRLRDIIERHILVLSQCTYLVMDEADRMVDLGFEDALNFIMDSMPRPGDAGADGKPLPRRVTMLYSATMPPSVEHISQQFLHDPAFVQIGAANQAVGTVAQEVEFVSSDEQRRARMLAVLDSGYAAPMIVFVNQKATADIVGRDLRRAGVRTELTSGMWLCSTLASRRTSARMRLRPCAKATMRFCAAPILARVVSICPTSRSCSTTSSRRTLRRTSTALVRAPY